MKHIWMVLALLGVAGLIVSTVMVVMSVRFGEWGRVLFYGVIAILCIEMAVIAWGKRKEIS